MTNDQILKNKWTESEFEKLLDLSTDMFSIIGFDGYFKKLNNAWETSFGFTKDEFKTKQFIEFIHPDDRESTLAELENLKKGRSSTRFKNRYLCKDGSYKLLSWNSSPVVDDKLIYSVSRDITEIKLKEEENLEHLKELKTIFDNIPIGITYLDTDYRFINANKFVYSLTGLNENQLIGQICYEVTGEYSNDPSKKGLEKICSYCKKSECVKSKKPVVIERPLGNSLVKITTIPELDEEGNISHFFEIIEDITESKKLESQLYQVQRLESIGTLASGITHDINNVLTPIMMSVGLLKEKIKDEQSQKILEIIYNNVQRGSSLIKQVQSFARGVKGERIPLQVSHIILDIRQVIIETFPKTITIETDIPKDLWIVSADATQLHQIFMNFCINSRDAMPDGGIIRISAQNISLGENDILNNIEAKTGDYILISVSDTGTGIPSEILDKIYEPFFTTKQLGKGTGLGLSIVYRIVKSHGGFIEVNSEIGTGTKFNVYLPASRKAETESEKDFTEILSGSGESIIVVDDEFSIREMTRSVLEENGYKVLTAENGKVALELYNNNRQDVKAVIMDLMMPVMNGYLTIIELRKINPKLKIIVISGLPDKNKLIGIGDSINAFLEKPFTTEQLLKTLNDVIR